MKYFRVLILSIPLLFLSVDVLAWKSVSSAKIVKFIQFNTGIERDYSIVTFKSDSGSEVRCYVSYEEKVLTSLILALYMSGKLSTAHCYDDELDIGGYKSHRLHRVVAN